LEVQYFHYHAALATTVSLNQTLMVDLSATIGTPTFFIGAEAGYEPNSSRLTKYTVGISVNKPDSNASIILNSGTSKANTHGSTFVLEADGRCVKTTNTEAHTMVVTIRMCKTLAYRKYSADMKTPRAIPMAIEKIILNLTIDVDLFGEEAEEKSAEERAAAVKASGKKKECMIVDQ
nr:mitochondrial outer membrane protein porin 2-like [Tanacetum cinerariifolium]